jgi:transposase-like protein
MRWTPKRKAVIVVALAEEQITAAEAKDQYNISDEELASWVRDYGSQGIKGLRVTRSRRYPGRLKPIADANGHQADFPIYELIIRN